jgi:hypothetical protein
MLGATPQIERLFGPQDFALGFASVVVISDGLWHRAYGADPNVVVVPFGSTMISLQLLGFFRADFAFIFRGPSVPSSL